MWLSIYIYYGGNANLLITDSLIPYAEKGIINKTVEKYFFVRYFDKGPHLRFRLLISKKVDFDVLKTDFILSIKNYLKHMETSSYWQKDWLDEKTILEIEYKPELERYGGVQLIEFAESQFMHSSILVAKYLNRNQYDYRSIIGFAIIIHTIFLFSIFQTKQDVLLFLQSIFLFKQIHNSNYARLFESQRDLIVPTIEKVLYVLLSNADFEDESLELWKEANTKVNRDIVAQANVSTSSYHIILQSFIHMTNNRLQIHNRDEVLILYFIFRTLDGDNIK